MKKSVGAIKINIDKNDRLPQGFRINLINQCSRHEMI